MKCPRKREERRAQAWMAWCLVPGLVTLLGVLLQAQDGGAPARPRYTLQFEEAPLQEVIAEFVDLTGLAVQIPNPGVAARRVTLHCQGDTPLELQDSLEQALEAMNLWFKERTDGGGFELKAFDVRVATPGPRGRLHVEVREGTVELEGPEGRVLIHRREVGYLDRSGRALVDHSLAVRPAWEKLELQRGPFSYESNRLLAQLPLEVIYLGLDRESGEPILRLEKGEGAQGMLALGDLLASAGVVDVTPDRVVLPSEGEVEIRLTLRLRLVR